MVGIFVLLINDIKHKIMKQMWKFGWVIAGKKTNWQYGTAEEAAKAFESRVNGATWFCVPVEKPVDMCKSWGIR